MLGVELVFLKLMQCHLVENSMHTISPMETEYLAMLRRHERGYKDQNFRPPLKPSFDINSSRVKFLAYYLPQFHPFKENNAWWGDGFTEWTNVTRGLPQYSGHYQPHLPSDLGFYDLRVPEAMEEQVRLAIQYGISGFCFYFYWFGGKRLMSEPLDLFVRNKSLNIDFCLCWANENWTRRWDGSESEILIGQEHSPQSDRDFIDDIIPYMSDPRYIRIDGRPVLIIYRATLLPDCEATAKRWNEEARRIIGTDLFLIYAMTFGNELNPNVFGFDAAIQFPPHGINAELVNHEITPFREDFSGAVFDYGSIVPRIRDQLASYDFPVIPAAFPGWDNTARRGAAAHSFRGATPDHYASWLAECAFHADNRPVYNCRYVVVNAWNEWAEGAHLEPDQRFGHSFLRATASVLRPFALQDTHALDQPISVCGPLPRQSNTAVIIHAYYRDELVVLLDALAGRSGFDLFITVCGENTGAILSLIAKLGIKATVTIHSNRGRDIRTFLQCLPTVDHLNYTYFVKLHTKRTTHRADGDVWFRELVHSLASLLDHDRLRNMFEKHPALALIAPAGHVLDGARFMGSAGNMAWLRRLCASEGIDMPETFAFAAGSMFAGRVDVFKPFTKPKYLAWFEDEEPRRDGTLAHAFERFFGAAVCQRGLTVGSVELIDDLPYCLGRADVSASGYGYAAEQHRSAGL